MEPCDGGLAGDETGPRVALCAVWIEVLPVPQAAIACPIVERIQYVVPGAAVTLVISGSAFATLAALRMSPPDFRQDFPHEFAAIEVSPQGGC